VSQINKTLDSAPLECGECAIEVPRDSINAKVVSMPSTLLCAECFQRLKNIADCGDEIPEDFGV